LITKDELQQFLLHQLGAFAASTRVDVLFAEMMNGGSGTGSSDGIDLKQLWAWTRTKAAASVQRMQQQQAVAK